MPTEFNKWVLYRQAIAIVEQAWMQLDGLLPSEMAEAKKDISKAFQNLRDALFKAEIQDIKKSRDENQ